jgi:hypothetical protein
MLKNKLKSKNSISPWKSESIIIICNNRPVYIEQGKIFDDEPTVLHKIVHEKYTDVNVPYSELSDEKYNLWDGDTHNVVPDRFGKVHYVILICKLV